MNKETRFFLYIILCPIVILVLSIQADPVRADMGNDPKYVFYKGNTLYEGGKYEEAIKEYSGLLEQGLESGNVYFNLGNSYFKKGDIGKAVLHYERAKRLIPRDSDLKSNYELALAQVRYNLSESPQQWFEKILPALYILTINEITVLLSVILTLVALFLTVRLFVTFSRNISLIILILSIVVLIFLACSLFNRISLLEREAIVITKSSEVRFEPVKNATVHFTLYEGMKVYLFQSKKDWNKIKRADGKVGWIRSKEMENI